MHELAITQSIFDIVLQKAKQAKTKKVRQINLVIGDMTGVVGDSVQFYVDILSKGTVVAGATVVIISVPAQVKCRTCGKIAELKPFDFTCPYCGGISLEVVGGKELFVESIEVE
jgi:hydrogenase nickel incorporation protein HypA/HybF